MKSKDFIKGLEILVCYYNDQNRGDMSAGGKAFIAPNTDRPLSDEDFKKMGSLGWYLAPGRDWVFYWEGNRGQGQG